MMLGLVLKKSLLEIWDHAVLVFILNLALLSLILALFLVVLGLGPLPPVAATLLLLAAGGLVLWALLAGLRLLSRITAHREPGVWWQASGDGRMIALAVALLAGLLAAALLAVDAALAAAPIIGVAMLTLAAWLLVLWVQLAFFLVPAILGADGNPLLAAKWVALLAFDNPAFSFACVVLALPILVLGLGLLPGPFGLLLFAKNALQLRLERYKDGSTEQPNWDALLAAERERLDRRRPITVLQPWRD